MNNATIVREHNHGAAFAAFEPALHMLVGLRHPRSTACMADGVFVAAQPNEGGTIHTCLFVDGVRFPGTCSSDKLNARMDYLVESGWVVINETDMQLVCFGMSHQNTKDIFWRPEYVDF